LKAIRIDIHENIAEVDPPHDGAERFTAAVREPARKQGACKYGLSRADGTSGSTRTASRSTRAFLAPPTRSRSQHRHDD
jgi:hypothetical protein